MCSFLAYSIGDFALVDSPITVGSPSSGFEVGWIDSLPAGSARGSYLGFIVTALIAGRDLVLHTSFPFAIWGKGFESL